MKPKKDTKYISHQEHEGHKEHEERLDKASGGYVTHFYCISLRRLFVACFLVIIESN